jgi:hypothetical protein
MFEHGWIPFSPDDLRLPETDILDAVIIIIYHAKTQLSSRSAFFSAVFSSFRAFFSVFRLESLPFCAIVLALFLL